MNGPGHYREAERLRDCAREVKDEVDKPDRWEWARYFLDAAQVHATLALVAANVGPWVAEGHDIGNPAPDEWADAIGADR